MRQRGFAALWRASPGLGVLTAVRGVCASSVFTCLVETTSSPGSVPSQWSRKA